MVFARILLTLLVCLLCLFRYQNKTGSVSGTVKDEKGAPIAKASVTLKAEIDGATREVVVTTDVAGRFETEGMAPGKWTATWKAADYYEKVQYKFVGPFGTLIPTEVSVVPGQTATLELVMIPVSVLVGLVQYSNGAPVANQPVWLVPPPIGGDSFMSTPGGKVQCDRAGIFRMDYESEGALSYALADASGNYAPRRVIELEKGKKTRHVFRLIRPASIAGQVVSADGKTPVAGAEVAAWSGEAEDSDNVPPPVIRVVIKKNATEPDVYEANGTEKANEKGYFRVFLHPGSRYVIGAATKTEVGESGVIRLSEGEHRVGLKIRLLPNPPDARQAN